MALRDLRPLIEQPFRKFATFSGRAGRGEYWLFILSVIILTNIAWLVGYGGMKLAGYPGHHDGKTYHHIHAPADDAMPDSSGLSHMGHEEGDSSVVLKFHPHSAEEGYHLHGSIDALYDDYGHGHDGHHDGHHHRHDDGTSSGHHGSETNDGQSRHLFTVRKDRRTTAGDGAGILKGLVTLALAVPLLAAGARRLHDTSKSGWWQLFVLIPLAGWLVLLIFMLLPGETDENRFGPPPGKD